MKTWFMNLPLSKKQILALLVAGVVPMVLVSIISLQVAKTEIAQQAFDQLNAVKEIKAEAVSRYFKSVEKQLITMSVQDSVATSIKWYKKYFQNFVTAEGLTGNDIGRMRKQLRDFYTNQYGTKYSAENEGKKINVLELLDGLDAEAIVAQYFYIANNENALGEKHLLDRSEGASPYHQVHEQFHSDVRLFLESFGYYDIFFVDIETGDIVYSVFKELDYGTSLLNGPYAQTNFARAFRKARDLDEGQIVIEDYKNYTPSYEAPASFAATPIVENGEKLGVLIFQMPLEPINAIMTERAGMGESGETYLVGRDLLMRSDSYLDPKNHSVVGSFKHPELGSVKTEATEEAFKGESNSKIIIDYNGNPVLSSYALIDILGQFQWAILAEIDESEAFAGVSTLTWIGLALVIIVAIVISLSALGISRLIVSPILALGKAIHRVEREGNFHIQLKNDYQDEIGDTSRAFSNLLQNLQGAISNTNRVLDELGRGNFSESVSTHYPGQLSELASGVNRAVEKVKLSNDEAIAQQEAANASAVAAQESAVKAQETADRAEKIAEEAAIVKQALDVASTSVMIADADFTISYCNTAAEALMQKREAKLRRSLPNFNASTLIGTSIDTFHKQPAHQRHLLQGLSDSYTSNIEVSGLTLEVIATPIRNDRGDYLGTVVEWQDLTESLAQEKEEKRIADENSRIRQALDCSGTSTMIADENYNIIYGNDSFQTMMKEAAPNLRQHLGNFDPFSLVGKNMDIFHKDPAHQRSLLNSLTSNYSTSVDVKGLTLTISATPIVNEEKERIGTVVEWSNRTAEVNIEREIDTVIESAADGDFSARIETDNKDGFFLAVSNGLNKLLETTNIALEDILRIFSALASGDLSQKIENDYHGEFAQLKRDANGTVDKLQEIIGNISSSSTNIARAADELSAGNVSLGQRTEEQAASLEETASSMEEMTSIVTTSEGNAKHANELAFRSINIAREGEESVSAMTKAMGEITQASTEIANIIGVIDEIAFQTNLLALNAAVEAARAGEQGRGFAVVAGEVRNLAQRSASAAKDIKDLIQTSVDKVEEGSKLATVSGETLKTIVSEIEKVGEKMQDLLSSATEQTTGIVQVNTAVSQMDQMTQENASLVEEATAASLSMAEQAKQLDQQVAFFRR